MNKRKPRVLFWDLENSHTIAAIFGLKSDQMISHENILQDMFMFCGAYKWLGDNKVYTLFLTPKELKAQDDRRIVRELCHIVNSADIIVAHNGDAFDIKKLRGRAIYHKLPPFKKPVSVDTLKVARREFGFISNRLDYLGKYLLDEGKIHTSNKLWLDCLKGDHSALKKMVDYNLQDVVLLEKIYLLMRPWHETHPNLNTITGNEIGCKACASTAVTKDGTKSKGGNRFQQYKCKDCGHCFYGSKAIKKSEWR